MIFESVIEAIENGISGIELNCKMKETSFYIGYDQKGIEVEFKIIDQFWGV